ncbi:MAG: BTAD domain-containing putative transcriptional regulator [Deinococcota bacterium]
MPAIKLLGTPVIVLDQPTLNQPISQPRGKTAAFLYYLAYQGGWVSRRDILYLFWPDKDEYKARANVRQLVRTVKKLPHLEGFESTASHVRWCVQTDVQAFQQAVQNQNFTEAVALYQGDLLANFRATAFPEFESWLELERVTLFNSYREASFYAAKAYEADGHIAKAAELFERLHRLEPLDEEVIRRYLELLALAEKRVEALKVFAAFKQQLALELDLNPEQTTLDLAENIRSGVLRSEYVAASDTMAKERSSRTKALPIPTTFFVGREAEASQLTRQLQDPACRLLSIVAAGGMGKTRLAIEVGQRLAQSYAEGVCFVPLEAVSSPALIVSAIADSLNLSFSGQKSPKEDVFAYFEKKHVLLILDNLEHLLEDVSLIPELLASVPQLNILTTSRERLNLHAEWLYDLGGMQVLASDEVGNHEANKSDAVRLFVQSAKKARASFELAETQLNTVVKICQLVGGMPLALELTASWLRILSERDVLLELEQGLDVLQTSTTDMPARHLSIANIFEASWSSLSQVEQLALCKLAVFEGGFTKTSAYDVAEVGLPLLLLLANKSFLRQDSTRRFKPHPLMWQFIRNKADQYLPLNTDIQEKHATYFMAFVQAREGFHEHPEVVLLRHELNIELANIRRAWQFATDHLREDLLGQSNLTLFWHFLTQGRKAEGAAFFEEASQTLSSESLTHARILHRHSALLNLSGDEESSRPILERSLVLKRQHGATWDTAHALLSLSFNYVSSDYASRETIANMWRESANLFAQAGDAALQGRSLTHQAVHTASSFDRETLLEKSMTLLRNQAGYHELSTNLEEFSQHVAYTHGNYAEGIDLIDEAIYLERTKGESHNLGARLVSKGYTLCYWGRFKDAQMYFEEVLSFGKSSYIHSQIDALTQLAHLAMSSGTLVDAKSYLDEALTRLQETKNRFLTAKTYNALAYVSLLDQKLVDAKQYSRQALAVFNKIKNVNYEIAFSKVLCLNYVATIAKYSNDLALARSYLLEALELAYMWSYKPAILNLLPNFAYVLMKDDLGYATSLLHLVIYDPATMFETQQAAQVLLQTIPEESQRKGSDAVANELSINQVVEDLLIQS